MSRLKSSLCLSRLKSCYSFLFFFRLPPLSRRSKLWGWRLDGEKTELSRYRIKDINQERAPLLTADRRQAKQMKGRVRHVGVLAVCLCSLDGYPKYFVTFCALVNWRGCLLTLASIHTCSAWLAHQKAHRLILTLRWQAWVKTLSGIAKLPAMLALAPSSIGKVYTNMPM